MPNTFHPTQLGYTPTGISPAISTLYMGRIVSGAAPYDGAGFGQGGRPDYLQTAMINLVERAANGTLTQKATITLNVNDVIAAMSANANVPTNLNLTLREVSVCDAGTNKRMLIIASAPYAAP